MDLKEIIDKNDEYTFKNNNSIMSQLLDLIVKNNLIFENDFPSIIEKQYNQIPFVKNKKIFNIIKINKKKEKFTKIKNNNSFEKNRIYNKFTSEDYNISNIIEKCNYIYINKSSPKKDKLNNMIDEEINKNINYNNNSENISNNKITKITDLYKQIKIKKNKKYIFMYENLLKKKKYKEIKESKNRRGVYRGVSKNGKKWQTIISYKRNIKYVGLYSTQEIAARVYDIASIKNKGINANTNFKYNVNQIQKISEVNIDYKSENIKEIISNLIG